MLAVSNNDQACSPRGWHFSPRKQTIQKMALLYKMYKNGCDEQQLRQPAPPSIATSKMGFAHLKIASTSTACARCLPCTSPGISPSPTRSSFTPDCQLLAVRWQHEVAAHVQWSIVSFFSTEAHVVINRTVLADDVACCTAPKNTLLPNRNFLLF